MLKTVFKLLGLVLVSVLVALVVVGGASWLSEDGSDTDERPPSEHATSERAESADSRCLTEYETFVRTEQEMNSRIAAYEAAPSAEAADAVVLFMMYTLDDGETVAKCVDDAETWTRFERALSSTLNAINIVCAEYPDIPSCA